MQNHLRSQGFSGALDGIPNDLGARVGSSKWTLPAAGLGQAEVGLLHVTDVLRERDAVRGDIDQAAHRLRQSLKADARGPADAPGPTRPAPATTWIRTIPQGLLRTG
jgi:hypothetical protein